MGPSKIVKMKFESQREWPHMKEGDTDGSHLGRVKIKLGTCCFKCWGLVVFLVRNVRKESSRLVGSSTTVTTICCLLKNSDGQS